MNLIKILLNIGSIISFFTTAKSFVKDIAEKKSVPDCGHTDALMDSFQKLIDKKVINIPGHEAEQEAVSSAIGQIRDQLKCKAN